MSTWEWRGSSPLAPLAGPPRVCRAETLAREGRTAETLTKLAVGALAPAGVS